VNPYRDPHLAATLNSLVNLDSLYFMYCEDSGIISLLGYKNGRPRYTSSFSTTTRTVT